LSDRQEFAPDGNTSVMPKESVREPAIAKNRKKYPAKYTWIPAFAGMTKREIRVFRQTPKT